ncbi:MAG: TlpA family protein disulfide reductase [Micavibrio sp.]|nr:TlpA family protein disulfide reductase [Micavibrio sp.]
MALTVFANGSYASNDESKVYELSAPQIVMLADQVKAKKIIFIYATWCPHCRKALPKVIELSKKHSGQVFAVSVDDKRDSVVRYYASLNDNPSYPLIHLTGKNRYSVEDFLKAKRRSGVPHFILMDESGNVIKSKNMHIEDVAEFLEN